jgi:hypothetical protein
LFLNWRLDYPEYDLILSMCMHGLIWGLLGAAAGLAFATGLRKATLCARTLAAGWLGAVLGTIAFEMIGAMFFSMAETDEPISETWPTRLMARLLVTVGTAVILIVLLPAPRPVETPARTETLPPSSEQ